LSFLLDTMIVSELRKQRPHGGLLDWYAAHPQSDYSLSAITLFEMQAGAERTRRQDAAKAAEIERWILQISRTANVIPLGELEAREAARFLHGHPSELMEDAMIAATASTHGLVVATRNIKHFKLFGVRFVDPFVRRKS